MAVSSPSALLDLPLEVLTGVCEQLDFRDLIRVAETCKRFRHGDGELESAELPTKSPVVTALREHAFPGGAGIPSTRSTGCSESWVAYMARCARQRVCREPPPIAAGDGHILFLDAAARLLACGKGAAVGHGDEIALFSAPTLVTALADVQVRSVAAGFDHSLALGWDGCVYTWGNSSFGALGLGDTRVRPSPMPVEGLEGVRYMAAWEYHSFALTQSGDVFQWGESYRPGAESSLRPIIVEGFGGVRMRRVCAGDFAAFAIGEDGELFSWAFGSYGLLGHGDTQNQPSSKRVEALRGVRVSSVSIGECHALALAEDGLVYAWGENQRRALLGDPSVERELLPRPVEALQGVRVGSIAAAGLRSYAVADTGEVWAWGWDNESFAPLGRGEEVDCRLPTPIESLRGIKVDAVSASHTLALADDGSVYAWGSRRAAHSGSLGLDTSFSDSWTCVPTPQRIPTLRVTCGF
jgi:alpha-tubulin suppressor-like RCC1 family protein